MALPRVQPIRPTWRKEPFDAPDWLFDLKYDGFRGMCYIEPDGCRLLSCNGKTFARFETLARQVATELGVSEAIVDGEVITADETGRPQFYDLLRRARTPAYVAFDLLWLDGADLRELPLSMRRQRLQSILPTSAAFITGTVSVTARGCELFDLMCANDLKGVVAKRLVDPYNSRVRWLKIKNRDYSQAKGRADLFNGPRQRPAHSAG
jgi:bifunctional non-homologous end joining protein LigD